MPSLKKVHRMYGNAVLISKVKYVRGILILTGYAEPFKALQYMKCDVSSTAICVILIKSCVQSDTEARLSASTTVLFSL